MEITVNNKIKIINNDSLISLLNELLGDKTKGIAIAINENIVAKSNWQSTQIKANDAILIIKATQGG